MPKRPLKIVVVDDSDLVRQGLTRLVSRIEEVEVVGEARTAPEALETIGRTAPDVVILDISLLEGSGFEVLGQLKKQSPGPVVIMFSNYEFPEYRQRARALGTDHFFDKATEHEQLIATLRGLARPPPNRGSEPTTER